MSLRVDDLKVYYRTLRGDVQALDGVTFDIADGAIMGLAGESGCGKSTLGKSLIRLDADGTERLTPITGSPPSLLNLPQGCPFRPRCPMSRERCDEEEPPLHKTDGFNHFAACHFWQELRGDIRADDVFDTTSVDDVDVAGDIAGTEPA